MNSIYNKFQLNRLKEKNIVIEEEFQKKFSDEKFKSYSDKELENNIIFCKKLNKKYIMDNNCLYKENKYSDKIYYTYISPANNPMESECTNCGNKDNSSNFLDGCPYCGTHINMYRETSSTIKENINIVLKNNLKKMVFILIAIYVVVVYIGTYFFEYNLLTGLLAGFFIIPALVFFLVIGIAMYSFIRVCIYAHNSKEEYYWKKLSRPPFSIKREKFMDDVREQLMFKYFYSDNKEKDLIDFDIESYKYLKPIYNNNQLYVNVNIKINKYYLYDQKVKKVKSDVTIVMMKNPNYISNKSLYQIITCSGCGASIDKSVKICDYCKLYINNFNEWLIYTYEEK